MTAKEVRNDLYDIRYYHTHRGMFNKPGMSLVKSTVEEKAERYEKIVKDGGSMTYALYTELYVEGNTQKRTAEKWQVKEGYVKHCLYLHIKPDPAYIELHYEKILPYAL